MCWCLFFVCQLDSSHHNSWCWMALASWLEGLPSPGEVSSLNLRCGGRYRGHNFQSISSWRFCSGRDPQLAGFEVGCYQNFVKLFAHEITQRILYCKEHQKSRVCGACRSCHLSRSRIGNDPLQPQQLCTMMTAVLRSHVAVFDPLQGPFSPSWFAIRGIPDDSVMIQGRQMWQNTSKPAMRILVCFSSLQELQDREGIINGDTQAENLFEARYFFHLHLFLWMILGAFKQKAEAPIVANTTYRTSRTFVGKWHDGMRGEMVAKETVRVLSFKKARLRVAVARQKGALYLVHLPVLKAGLGLRWKVGYIGSPNRKATRRGLLCQSGWTFILWRRTEMCPPQQRCWEVRIGGCHLWGQEEQANMRLLNQSWSGAFTPNLKRVPEVIISRRSSTDDVRHSAVIFDGIW